MLKLADKDVKIPIIIRVFKKNYEHNERNEKY